MSCANPSLFSVPLQHRQVKQFGGFVTFYDLSVLINHLVAISLVWSPFQIPLGGDIRPYFTMQDSDHAQLINRLPPKAGLLLGVTNPFFEKSCVHWPHVLSLGRRMQYVIISDQHVAGIDSTYIDIELLIVQVRGVRRWALPRAQRLVGRPKHINDIFRKTVSCLNSWNTLVLKATTSCVSSFHSSSLRSTHS